MQFRDLREINKTEFGPMTHGKQSSPSSRTGWARMSSLLGFFSFLPSAQKGSVVVEANNSPSVVVIHHWLWRIGARYPLIKLSSDFTLFSDSLQLPLCISPPPNMSRMGNSPRKGRARPSLRSPFLNLPAEIRFEIYAAGLASPESTDLCPAN